MAKTLTKTTRSPIYYNSELDVLAEDVQLLQNAISWAAAERNTTCHLTMHVGEPGWDDYGAAPIDVAGSGDGVGSLNMRITASAQLYVVTDLWVDVDTIASDMECGIECHVATAGNVATITFELVGSAGTQTTVITCNDTHNDTERTGTIDMSLVTTGDEWIVLTITMEQTTGSGVINAKTLRVQELAIVAADVPDPVA